MWMIIGTLENKLSYRHRLKDFDQWGSGNEWVSEALGKTPKEFCKFQTAEEAADGLEEWARMHVHRAEGSAIIASNRYEIVLENTLFIEVVPYVDY